ncbi:MAG: leucine--tRNA ligase [Pyrinomonadaceae bacterium]|nr:leucine--tRNA ligase [Pyrinomonadaceae bacterium]
MDEKYFAKKVEQKWQQKWAETGAFEAEAGDPRPKFYQLEMLPYPSGNLHMGHVRNYSAGDAMAWYKRLRGFNVLHPIGWDSFGQPAEDAAIKRGVNPRDWTEENIVAMRGQLERLGLSYDWRRQMAAHRPEYYKFDQWFFLKMHEMGLAYKKVTQVNWCSTDQATLSNEQASGGLCWRCGNPVTKKEIEQWFLKTTAYTDQLLDDMAEIADGWPANVLKRQSDWIGRSEGAFVDFEIRASGDSMFYCPLVSGLTSTTDLGKHRVRVFTTRIDTIYGVNALVLAAEHPVIQANMDNFDEVVAAKIAMIRVENARPADHEVEIEKDGIDTGLRAINPFSNEELPVWVGNYVMMEYGTGALMSVPAHDERDFEFAQKFGLPIRQVISEPHMEHAHHTMQALALEQAFPDYSVLVHSDFWNGKTSEQAKKEMAEYAEKYHFGEAATTYRLRDWGISRQRFWGSPIPIVYCDACGVVPEKYENLPVELPASADFSGTGESPLAKLPEWYQTTCPKCDGPARRETDTMDTFVDSSWYYYRYTDHDNEILPFGPDEAAYWTPVDQYIGGDDHAVMHLIYARFWTKVMRDMGLVEFNEPFKRLLTQGMVVGETFFDDSSGKRVYFPPDQVTVERDSKGRITSAVTGGNPTGREGAPTNSGTPLKYSIERMSKSKGNGVDPDEMVEIYGADAARLFVMFAAPIENELVWNEAGIEGAVRFLQRVWRQVFRVQALACPPPGEIQAEACTLHAARKLSQKTHQTIKRVGDSFEALQFNTPVAALMELSNAIGDIDVETADDETIAVVREALTALVLMLTPFAPHTAEDLYSVLIGNDDGMLANGARFPEYKAELAKADEIEIAVQVNGKLRSRLLASPEATDQELEYQAFADVKVREYTDGKDVVKVVVVPKRLVNIVVR